MPKSDWQRLGKGKTVRENTGLRSQLVEPKSETLAVQQSDDAGLHCDATALLILPAIHEAELAGEPTRDNAVACKQRVCESGFAMVDMGNDA